MTLQKRFFDIVFALLLGAVLILPALVLVLLLLVTQGRPVFYLAERMKAPGQPFLLWKFRTMRVVASADSGVSGGDKSARITPLGRILRRLRLDEVPQLWNILRGDMSFVGPRPPLRQYVDRFPALYAQVLQSRPGVTGLASLLFHAREEQLLAPCTTIEQTDAVYVRRCIPRKAQLDLIYQRHQSLCFDAGILGKTVIRVILRRIYRRS